MEFKLKLMKTPFIFITILFLFVSGCASSNQQAKAEDSALIAGNYQHWFATTPGESEFSERGIDLLLELHQHSKIYQPEYIIFNERESFPVEVSQPEGEDGKLLIKARILLESSLFAEKSQKAHLSDRLVFRDEDGELHHIEISNWKRLPDRYD